MKRRLGYLAAAVLVAFTVTGCGSKDQKGEDASGETVNQTVAESVSAETEETKSDNDSGGRRLGLAVVSSAQDSRSASEERDGTAQVDSVVAAVVLDGEGKIIDCIIDTAQSKMTFSREGKVLMENDFKTKRELGDDYGMRGASGIDKEWYEQADAFEAYVNGKTADEVAAIVVDEDGKLTDTDTTAGVTIAVDNFLKAVITAADGAKELGTMEGDRLGLGVVTNMEKSYDAKEDKDGQCQAYTTYTAVTTDADGKITAGLVDATQGTVEFDVSGKITSDLDQEIKSKKQLGDSYGMKGASGIGKEWYEQAAAFEQYVIGKTAQEVAETSVDEDQKPTDEDLTASVTISIGDFQQAILKASE